jgi:hypothetical protein
MFGLTLGGGYYPQISTAGSVKLSVSEPIFRRGGHEVSNGEEDMRIASKRQVWRGGQEDRK